MTVPKVPKLGGGRAGIGTQICCTPRSVLPLPHPAESASSSREAGHPLVMAWALRFASRPQCSLARLQGKSQNPLYRTVEN